jgi:hypothetical protein
MQIGNCKNRHGQSRLPSLKLRIKTDARRKLRNADDRKTIKIQKGKSKMNESKSCGSKHIKGITCDVYNCEYHGKENSCMAGCIAVGPGYAETSSDTVCATFRPKEKL